MVSALVVTPDVSFGELIRQNLKEMGRFRVDVLNDKNSAISSLNTEEYALIFLDTYLDGKDLLEIGTQARRIHAGVRFVVISEPGWHAALDELSPDDYLTKPFNQPDLVGMMDTLFPAPKSSDDVTPSETGNEPAWLSDVTRAAQHLARLSLGTSAQAALITRDEQLWAYAGQLPQSATRELTEIVSRYWDRQAENDLMRFVRLASTEAEHMLYATRLAPNVVLALIFDAETPFSTIRTQAGQLVHSLSISPNEKAVDEEQAEEEEVPSAPLSAILTDIPSPNPKVDARIAALKGTKEPNPVIPLHFSRESSPAIPVNQVAPNHPIDPSIDETSIDLGKAIEPQAPTRKNKPRRIEPDEEEPGETRPSSTPESTGKIVLEPISSSVFNLDYACLLVPRFAHHHLIGDLSDRLSDWVPDVCIAFDWRLEYISVRPGHLMWIVSVRPATSPGYLMRIMRQITSERIFENFPRLKKENPSGDFWASGYLIMGGSQPPPVNIIKDFIAQTRQRQGNSQHLR